MIARISTRQARGRLGVPTNDILAAATESVGVDRGTGGDGIAGDDVGKADGTRSQLRAIDGATGGNRSTDEGQRRDGVVGS